MASAETIRRRALAVAAVAGLALAGCGKPAPRRDGAGQVDRSGYALLLKLRTGDCIGNLRSAAIDSPDDGSHNGVPTVQAVPCAQPHDAQIVSISPLGGGPWPGSTIVEGAAASGRTALAPRLSRIAKSSPGGDLTLFTFDPTQERWEFEKQHTIVFAVLFAHPRRGVAAP